MIEQLDMYRVREHYDSRFDCHQRLSILLKKGKATDYLYLALGISEPDGNYSAWEHELGPQILAANRPERIVGLAQSFLAENDPKK